MALLSGEGDLDLLGGLLDALGELLEDLLNNDD